MEDKATILLKKYNFNDAFEVLVADLGAEGYAEQVCDQIY